MKVKLTKINSAHANLRTDSVEGESVDGLRLGAPFEMTGPSLANPNDPLEQRRVTTGFVVSSIKVSDNVMEFHTQNSHYRLEYLPQEPAPINENAG